MRRLLGLVLLAHVLTSTLGNQIVLEGFDGVLQFGDDSSAPLIRREPDANGGLTDQLRVTGASGLVVDGAITANLLDVNATGGSILANELIVNSLTVNGAAPAQGASGGGCPANAPRIALRLTVSSVDGSHVSAVPGIPGMASIDRWAVDTLSSQDEAGVFTLTGGRTITVEQDGYYMITYEDFFKNGASDWRHVSMHVALGGTVLSTDNNRPCTNTGARNGGESSRSACSLKLAQGTVLGTYLLGDFEAPTGSHGAWTVTQTGTY